MMALTGMFPLDAPRFRPENMLEADSEPSTSRANGDLVYSGQAWFLDVFVSPVGDVGLFLKPSYGLACRWSSLALTFFLDSIRRRHPDPPSRFWREGLGAGCFANL